MQAPGLHFSHMACVYILKSDKLVKFYTGSCLDSDARFNEHLQKVYKTSFTAKADDWAIFLVIDGLSLSQARGIERHIKTMKSSRYIENLQMYPEIIKKLKEKYS
jgi:putative endonuclease